MLHNARNIRVLIIDDDEDDFFITSDYINNIPAQRFDIDWCYSYSDALVQVRKAAYDIYFVDYRLGAKTGIDLIQEAIEMQCDEPIILLTGKGDFNIDVQAMRTGAFDYLVKSDLNTEKLERTIRYALERASTLSALRASEKKFRNIFDRSKDAVFVTDENFFFTRVNDAFCRLMNTDAAVLLTKRLTDLAADKHLRQLLEEKLQSAGDLEDQEIELRTEGNELHQCLLSASREKDMESRIYYQGILHDISALRKAERMTLQAEKLAAAGRLVRTLAHEVRNPLNNINLAAEQLKLAHQDDDSSLFLNIIARNSNRINELINELLHSSRPAEMQLGNCTLQSLMDEILASSTDRMQLKKMTWEVDMPSGVIALECDLAKLTMALLNIVINAIEAMEEGKGHLAIAAEVLGSNLLLEISDNGSGISADHLPRLFEPYFTSKRNGIGLGLAATLNIVQSHQGNIEVSSVANEGTTFSIILPIVKRLNAA